MRIIAGRFKGRRLKGPKGGGVRPTSDRLRESLFNILAPRIAESVFIDAFAGTGAIGLEALSRGARQVVFIESSQEAGRLIRDNLALCGVRGAFRLLTADVWSGLRTLERERFQADIVFLDPPYEWGPYRALIEIIFRTGIACDGAQVIVEHHRKTDLPPSGEGFERTRVVRHGDHALSFYQAAP